jgi:outer membrane immunogenic protein
LNSVFHGGQRRKAGANTMKKFLLGTVGLVAFGMTAPALAADLPARTYTKAPAMVASVYNWSGFYIGGHVGGGWGDLGSTEIAPGTGAFPIGTAFTRNNLSGPLGGVQGGFNWQTGSLVLGVEGEYSWENLSGTARTASVVLPAFVSNVTANATDLALATARVGYAANNWLFYVKGGGAWGHGNSNGTTTGPLPGGALSETNSTSADRSGWVVGGGIEWGFAPNWSAKLEYNHVDFGSKNITIVSSITGTSFVSSSERLDIVKAGVNYRFNWGAPVVARY